MKQRAINSFGSFRSAVKLLREDLSPGYPVNVRRCKVSVDAAGTCAKRGNKFFICVSKDLEEDASILVLFHEWAHALSWDSKFMPGDHNVIWGIAYAQVWKTWLASQ